jgi:hypothetical protein
MWMKQILFVLIIMPLVNSCVAFELLHTTAVMVEYSSTYSETLDSADKLSLSLENKTNETLVVFVLFSDNQRQGAELARIPAQSLRTLKLSQGKSVRIVGGLSRLEYRDIQCNYDGEYFTIYPIAAPQSNLNTWQDFKIDPPVYNP